MTQPQKTYQHGAVCSTVHGVRRSEYMCVCVCVSGKVGGRERAWRSCLASRWSHSTGPILASGSQCLPHTCPPQAGAHTFLIIYATLTLTVTLLKFSPTRHSNTLYQTNLTRIPNTIIYKHGSLQEYCTLTLTQNAVWSDNVANTSSVSVL